MECRRDVLKLVNYHERKFGNTAFRDTFVSVFFILQGEADRWVWKIMPERKRANKS